MGRLNGKVAIISGGARGLGAANAGILAAEGANVVIADEHETEGKELVKSLGSQGCFVFIDVADPSDWMKTVEIAENTFGRVNILVNNTGIENHAPFDEYTNQQFGESIEGNLYGTFYAMKAVIPSMKIAGSGSIINVSSVSGLQGYSGQPGYVASNWGVRGLTKSAALDLARYHIRVNSVHPGQILTPQTRSGDIETGHIAMHRLGTPDEIARVVLFLAMRGPRAPRQRRDCKRDQPRGDGTRDSERHDRPAGAGTVVRSQHFSFLSLLPGGRYILFHNNSLSPSDPFPGIEGSAWK